MLVELAAEQQQMLFPWLDVQNDDFLQAAWSGSDLEEFANFVSTNIENHARGFLPRPSQVPTTSCRHVLENLHAYAHPRKISVQITAHCFFLSKDCPWQSECVHRSESCSEPFKNRRVDATRFLPHFISFLLDRNRKNSGREPLAREH